VHVVYHQKNALNPSNLGVVLLKFLSSFFLPSPISATQQFCFVSSRLQALFPRLPPFLAGVVHSLFVHNILLFLAGFLLLFSSAFRYSFLSLFFSRVCFLSIPCLEQSPSFCLPKATYGFIDSICFPFSILREDNRRGMPNQYRRPLSCLSDVEGVPLGPVVQ